MIDTSLPEFAPFWTGCREGVLRVQWCSTCRRHQWPPRPMCVRCGGVPVWVETEGAGELYSWTVVHLSPLPAFAGSVPYVVAIAELPHADRIRVVARLTEDAATSLSIGIALVMGFERVDDESLALPVWRLDSAPAAPTVTTDTAAIAAELEET